MNRKWIITRLEEKIITSVIEDDQVAELHCMDSAAGETVALGNIYVGKVKNIVQNIGGAFIEIGDGAECYYELEGNPTPIFTHKIGKKALCIGDELLVQVSKEAVKTKVPTVTSKLNFTGKYAVLTYGDSRIGVSSKISKEEKERLQELAKPYITEKYGFILRTNAKETSAEMITAEIERLVKEYETLMDTAQTRVCFSCLTQAPKQYLADLRNIYQEGLSEFIVEDKDIYEEVKVYLQQQQPEDLDKLRLYDDAQLPLHKLYSIETHVSNALREHVWLKSGAYLVIQPTEALTVIDVNTGKNVSKKKDEETYYKINVEAAKEIARQIRLRNLSGIILIDFINMEQSEKMELLLETFRKELKKDPIATTLVDVTKLQLVEVTRKKVRKPFYESFR